MTTRPYSDEQLSAWVDGEGSAAERAGIEQWLRAHPDEERRVRGWVHDREALHAAYARVVHEPVPARLAEVVLRTATAAATPSRLVGLGRWLGLPTGPDGLDAPGAAAPRWRLAGAAALLFVLGAAVGGGVAWQWRERLSLAQARSAAAGTQTAERAPEAWLQRAAFAHSVYTIEPRHAVEVRAQEEHLARWLTRRIEAPVKLFDLRDQGYELVGGRLLPDGPGKGAQLMYQDANGQRITVYLRKPEPGSDTAFRFEQHGKLGMFYWVEERCGFALVGELPKERLLALAKAIYDQDAVLPPPSLTPPASAPGSASAASAPPSAPTSSTASSNTLSPAPLPASSAR